MSEELKPCNACKEFEATCSFGPDEQPVCEDCHRELEREYKCKSCDGIGEVSVCRDQYGNIDYINGRHTNEFTRCICCHGEGYRW